MSETQTILPTITDNIDKTVEEKPTLEEVKTAVGEETTDTTTATVEDQDEMIQE